MSTKRNGFLILFALMFVISLTAVMLTLPEASYAQTSEDNYFIAREGGYNLGSKADTSADGLPFTLIPYQADGDVRLTLNGVFTRGLNWDYNENKWTGSAWGARLLINLNSINARAFIITYKNPADPTHEMCLVLTKKGSYFSLISDISLDDSDEPYVTGTSQYLAKYSVSVLNAQIGYYVSTSGDVILNDAGAKVCNITDAVWREASSENLPDELKARYEETFVNSLLNDIVLNNACILEMDIIGLAQQHTIYLRSFNGINYYSGQSTLSMVLPKPLLIPKHNALIKSAGTSYSLTDLFSVLYNDLANNDYIQGFYTTNTATDAISSMGWLRWGQGTWTKTTVSHGSQPVYYVAQMLTKGSLENGSYLYGKFDVIERADQAVAKKTEKLYVGTAYKLSDMLKNLKTLNVEDSNLEVLVSTAPDGTYSSIGALDGTYTFTPESAGEVTFYVKVKDTELAAIGKPSETDSSQFTFTAEIPAPVVTFKAKDVTYGDSVNLATLFTVEALGPTVKYFVNGEEMGPDWTPLSGGQYTIKCVVTDSYGAKAEAEGILNVKTGNEFVAKEGSYILAAKANASVDGLPLTLIPDETSSNVHLYLNGAFKRGLSWDDAKNEWTGSSWSSRLLVNFSGLNARAIIITYINPADQSREMSLVMTKGGVYFSLISDISLDQNGEPYVTGTAQYLVKSNTNYHSQIGYYVSADGTVTLNDAGVTLCKITDTAWRNGSSKDLPDHLKVRYTEESVSKLLNDITLNTACKFEMSFLGLSEEATIYLRGFNGVYYFTNQANLRMKTPDPLLVPKHNALIKAQSGSYSLSNIFEVISVSPENVNYIQGFTTTDKSKLMGVVNALKWGQGTYTNSTFSANAEKLYYVMQVISKDSIKLPNGSYLYGSFEMITDTNQVIAKKTETLVVGRTYKLSDIFVNLNTLNPNSLSLEIGGYLGETSASGTFKTLGALGTDTLLFETDQETFSFYIRVKDTSLSAAGSPSETAYSVFTFNVDLNKPVVKGLKVALVEGLSYKLSDIFDVSYYGEATIRYYIDGVEYNSESWVAQSGEHSLKCVITDFRSFVGENEFVVTPYVIDIAESLTIDFERGSMEYFPDPALPDKAMTYTVALFKGSDDIESAQPLTTSISYSFVESGIYKLVYYIDLYGTQKTYITQYNVTVVEPLPEINVGGTYESSYYSGMEIDVWQATAANRFTSFEVRITVTRDGQSVAIDNGKLKLSPGNYKIIYQAVKDSQTLNSLSFEFAVTEDNEKPTIIVLGQYSSEYENNTQITVFDCNVIDNSGASISADIKIFRDGKEIAYSKELVLLGPARYEIVYSAKDGAGNSFEKKFEFTVKGSGEKKGCKSAMDGALVFATMLILCSVLTVKRRKETL